MKITRNVILDLLPLYLADEVSGDTRVLIEQYLETDPELAKMAKQVATTSLTEVPVPISREDAMQAYVKANQRMIMRTLALAAVIVVVIMIILTLAAAFFTGYFGA